MLEQEKMRGLTAEQRIEMEKVMLEREKIQVAVNDSDDNFGESFKSMVTEPHFVWAAIIISYIAYSFGSCSSRI